MHAGKTIKPKTLAGILDDLGVGLADLSKLL